MSHAGWALTGLALGAVGGFFAGRHGQVTGSGGISERIAVGTSHAVTAVGRSGAETMEGVVIGESGRLKGLIPLDATPQQTLRHILAIPDSLNRLAALKGLARSR